MHMNHAASLAPGEPATPVRFVTLPDGRRLAYEESGRPDGQPIFFFHGWSSSRLLRHPDDAGTAALGVRLITVDRPGAGFSDFQPRRTLLDWGADVAALADSLRLDRFALVAHSGAGPHALAVARRLGDRVRRVAVVSGFAPVDGPGATDDLSKEMRQAVGLLRRLPFMAGLILRPLPARYRRDPAAAFQSQFGRGLPESDRAALARLELGRIVYAAAAEAFWQGHRGAAHEMLLFLARPWGFSPEEISVPVSLWYGSADTVVPIGMGRALARAIPKAELVEIPGAGHMAFLEKWADILRAAAAG
jgi:pimeloyl-ACP methyl ester carboxylesterase